MKTYKVKKWREFLNVIRETRQRFGENCWFRGHSNVDYMLLPGAYRVLYVVEDQFGRPLDPVIVKNYNNRGDKVYLPHWMYLTHFIDELKKEHIKYPSKIVDQLCMAQHYGLKTSLLDWSTDLSIGLFFACDKRIKGTEAAIYILNPRQYNDDMNAKDKIFSSKELEKDIGSFLFPIAFTGPRKDKRMCRQSGNFTMHNAMIWPLDYNDYNDSIIKIEIDGLLMDEIEKTLTDFGITHDSIYVQRDIKDNISKIVEAINCNDLNMFDYSRAAEPPVRCGESHLSGLTEPPSLSIF